MRCPKCQYISFESGERCRNCGYEFSLAVDQAELDLPIRTGSEPVGPLTDLDLEPRSAGTRASNDGPGAAPTPRRSGAAASGDLPLFSSAAAEHEGAIVPLPPSPRTPASVRRTPGAAKGSRPHEPVLDLHPPEAEAPAAGARSPALRAESADALAGRAVAPVGARMLAAAVDLVLLLSIDAGVLYLTLRFCGLTPEQIGILPIVPFLAFLAILNGGYLVTFTVAGGQTIGKMTSGIRVVNADESAWTDRVALAQSVIRAVAYLASAAPAGAGFLAALVSADRRALHDRIAGTRVVRA